MITYIKIISASKAFRKIASMDLKVKDAIKVAKLIKKLDEECSFYYEQKNRYCEKYGKFEEDKNAYLIPEDNRKEFADKMNELDETAVEIQEKIKITVTENMTIDAASIVSVEDFIDFVFEEDKENGN